LLGRNRYDAGMTFGAHVDNAIRGYLNTPLQRSDLVHSKRPPVQPAA
jgi:predicted 2-oxoglutarate/Fe(II)-dependent dioxygenase YbiX